MCVPPRGLSACGKLQFTDDEENELRNPTVIVEVLSESTEAYDRGDKLAHDQTIRSLRDVVFVATSGARLDHSTRQSDRTWARRSFAPGEAVSIASIDVSFGMDDAYENVFEPSSS